MRFPLCLALLATTALAQSPSQSPSQTASQSSAQATPNPYIAPVAQLMQQPPIQRAFAAVDSDHDYTLRQWIALTEINSPSAHEEPRAQAVIAELQRLGYQSQRDAVHDVIIVRKGSDPSLKHIVFDSHLDTVFQPGLKIKVRQEGGKLYAPGVGDDTRNVAAMLAMLRAMDAAKIKTRADIVFLFTTGEETGLYGAHQYVADHKNDIGAYIALDGGNEGFSYSGIGINWYREHFIGPGGHTRSKTPPYSATLPLARAIERIYALPVPERANLNIGMLSGSEVANAKASDAWFSVDLRSSEQADIDDLEKRIGAIVNEEAAREKMQARIEVLDRLPASQRPENRHSKLSDTAEAAFRAIGYTDIPITNNASNNANEALLAGLPAIATGTAPCEKSHSLDEYCEAEPIYKGIKKVILLGVAMAGLE